MFLSKSIDNIYLQQELPTQQLVLPFRILRCGISTSLVSESSCGWISQQWPCAPCPPLRQTLLWIFSPPVSTRQTELRGTLVSIWVDIGQPSKLEGGRFLNSTTTTQGALLPRVLALVVSFSNILLLSYLKPHSSCTSSCSFSGVSSGNPCSPFIEYTFAGNCVLCKVLCSHSILTTCCIPISSQF